MVKGDQISPILAAGEIVNNFSKKSRRKNEEVISNFRRQRHLLISLAKEKGLRVKPLLSNYAINDLFEADDGGKPIESFFKIVISSADEAVSAVKFCQEYNLGAMAIGAKTSAIGLFEAHNQAIRCGLDGIVGLQIDPITSSEKLNANQAPLLNIPKFESSQYDLIYNENRSIAVLKSKDDKTNSKVIGYAGVTVKQINDFLNDTLSSKKYYYRIMPDPTSIADAQLGGIISTGAQGGNRANAAYDISEVTLVNADAQIVTLIEDDAKNIVGLNGCAGIVLQAQFEVSQFPKHEHGLYVPIGNLQDTSEKRWLDILEIQHKLKAYCLNSNNQDAADCIVTGIELLSYKGLLLAQEAHNSSLLEKLLRLNQNFEFGLFVTFQSFIEVGSEEIFQTPLMKTLLGDNFTDLASDEDDNLITKGNKYYSSLRYVGAEELIRLDAIRHAIPYSSRELARRMGGVTESTDINVRITSEDYSVCQRAYKKLAKVYADYVSSFLPSDGFDAIIYGHTHPGIGTGGGIDPHIRVIFELSNPGGRYNAPEQVSGIKKRKAKFEQKLLSLNGIDSIAIQVPEKSCFGSSEYWSWLCLNQPNLARQILSLTKFHGTSQKGLSIFSFRVPRLTPDFLQIPSDWKGYSRSNVLWLLQQPVRSAIIQKINLELQTLLFEKLNLYPSQYCFILENKETVLDILQANNIKSFVEQTDIETLVCSRPRLNPENVYEISCQSVQGAENIKLILLSEKHIEASFAYQKSPSVSIAWRNIYAMWQSWPFKTIETPPVISIISLINFLAQENVAQGFKNKFKDPVYAGATPAKLNSNLESDFFDAQADIDESQAIEKLKNIIGIPAEYSVGFFGSVQQALVSLANSCAQNQDTIKVTIVHGDPFSDQIVNIFKSKIASVNCIRIPWTTSEYSQLEYVVDRLVDSFTVNALENSPLENDTLSNLKAEKKNKILNIVILVPHKTTTTADVHPDRVVNELSKRGLLMGKDFHLLCDISSAVGARDYAKLLSPDTGSFRLSFTGLLGNFHAAFGLPTGCAFISLSPALAKLASKDLSDRFISANKGSTNYRRWLSAFLQANYTNASKREAECYKKFRLTLGWLEKHPDLICLVPNSVDQSPAMLGIFSQAKNLAVARRLLRDIFGHQIDPGFGPFEKESIRIYLANITETELIEILSCLDSILELPDVVQTRGENIPNIALREPHDPLSVIERLSISLTVDDLIRNQPGLAWLSRLIKTFNANVDDLVQVPIDGENPTGEYKMKARIYAAGVNLREMQKILSLRDEETKLDIVFHYELFRDVERHLRRRVIQSVESTWSDDSNSAAISVLLDKAKEHLKQLAHLLRKFVKGDEALAKASIDQEGRVRWPIVA